MPLIGLGTWESSPGEVGAAVTTALDAGCRHIDCAAVYLNEKEVGDALSAAFAGGLTRSEVFVTSKLGTAEHAPEHVRAACVQTLRDLKLDYLDLYLVHWPIQLEHVEGSTASIPIDPDGTWRLASVPLADTWQAMERLVDDGLAKAIGLSNFNAVQMQRICDGARIRPVCNQVECHPVRASLWIPRPLGEAPTRADCPLPAPRRDRASVRL